jgi:hypothetical protein
VGTLACPTLILVIFASLPGTRRGPDGPGAEARRQALEKVASLGRASTGRAPAVPHSGTALDLFLWGKSATSVLSASCRCSSGPVDVMAVADVDDGDDMSLVVER